MVFTEIKFEGQRNWFLVRDNVKSERLTRSATTVCEALAATDPDWWKNGQWETTVQGHHTFVHHTAPHGTFTVWLDDQADKTWNGHFKIEKFKLEAKLDAKNLGVIANAVANPNINFQNQHPYARCITALNDLSATEMFLLSSVEKQDFKHPALAGMAAALLAARPDTTPLVLASLISHVDDLVRHTVIQRSDCSPTLLAVAALGSDIDRAHVAAHPNTPAEVLSALAHDYTIGVRSLVAAHKNTPPETFQLFLDDVIPVQKQAAKNPSCPPRLRVLLHLAVEGNK